MQTLFKNHNNDHTRNGFRQIKWRGALTVVALAAAVLCGSGLDALSGHASAVTQSRTYMQIYSQQGTYTRVKIQAVNISDDAHVCGGSLTAANSHTYIKRLSKTRPIKLNCSAVSNPASYTVTFYKGKSASPSSVVASGVDVNSGHCTVINPSAVPASATISGLTNACPAAVLPETITKHDVTSHVCVNNSSGNCVNSTTNLNARRGIRGHITLTEDTPWDGDQNMSKYFCSGTVSYTYHDNQRNTDQGPYTAKLKYKSSGTGTFGRCIANIGRDASKLSVAGNYTINTSYGGNSYLNASAQASATFTTK